MQEQTIFRKNWRYKKGYQTGKSLILATFLAKLLVLCCIKIAKKIDLIVTKSVSRFARNTVDSLTTVRKLKDEGIEIYFEKKDLWTEGVVKMLKKNQISEIYQRQISSENNGIPLIEAVFTAE